MPHPELTDKQVDAARPHMTVPPPGHMRIYVQRVADAIHDTEGEDSPSGEEG